MFVALLLAATAPVFVQHPTWNDRSALFDRKVERDGLHAQLVVGFGGWSNAEGLFHAAELGFTFANGVTLAVLQTAVQNKGIVGPERGADLIGGWLLEVKVPVLFPELELKVAAGVGGLLDESRPQLHLVPGFGWSYGVDFHLPLFASSGPTIGLTVLHALVPQHYFTVSVGAGYTFF